MSKQQAEPVVVNPAELTAWNDTHTAVFVPDAFAPVPGGIWVHKLTTATVEKIRQASRVGTRDDEGLVSEKFQYLELAESLRLGPERDAQPLFPPMSYEFVSQLDLGVRLRLTQVCDALLGYDNAERSKLGNYLGGEAFSRGASPDSTASPEA